MTTTLDRCFQLMETDDPSLFDVWLDNWRDLGEFEIYPVIDSAEAARRVDVTWPASSPEYVGSRGRRLDRAGSAARTLRRQGDDPRRRVP